MKVKEGDVFLTKLERDFYGAFRILKANGRISLTGDTECVLVGITKYIGKNKPNLLDSKLKNILIEQRFFCNNKPAIGIRTLTGIENFEYLGNIPIASNKNEYKIEIGDGTNGCYPLYGAFESNFGYNAFLEWRWENEREEFEAEVEKDRIESEKRREEYRKQQMKPKKMLDDTLFWEVIEKIDWDELSDENQMKPAIDFLSKKKVTEIKQFQESLTYKLYQLDTKEHAKNIGDQSYKGEGSHFSPDYFLYVRCCVIANGKDYFNRVLSDPTKMPKDKDYEPLLYVAEEAYAKRMKKDLEYETGCNYETFSNFEGWK